MQNLFGFRPVKRAARDGEQTGDTAYMRARRRVELARDIVSRWGVKATPP